MNIIHTTLDTLFKTTINVQLEILLLKKNQITVFPNQIQHRVKTGILKASLVDYFCFPAAS